MSGLLISYEGNDRNLHEAWQGNRDASRGKVWTEGPFLLATVILGFLSIFNKNQASSSFKAFNSICLSSCQRDVMPPVLMRWGNRAFSRVSTEVSDIFSSCEMKDEPAFKPLQEIQPSFESQHLGVHST